MPGLLHTPHGSTDYFPEPFLPHSALVAAIMLQAAAKWGFTMESLVAKDVGTGEIPGRGDTGSHLLAVTTS